MNNTRKMLVASALVSAELLAGANSHYVEAATRPRKKIVPKTIGKVATATTVPNKPSIKLSPESYELRQFREIQKSGVDDPVNPGVPKTIIKTPIGEVAIASSLYKVIKQNNSNTPAKLIIDTTLIWPLKASEDSDAIRIQPVASCAWSEGSAPIALSFAVINNSGRVIKLSAGSDLSRETIVEKNINPIDPAKEDLVLQSISLAGASANERMNYWLDVGISGGDNIKVTGKLPACGEILSSEQSNILQMHAVIFDAANGFMNNYK